MALLEVKDLSAEFRTRQGVVKAVNEVSFHIEKGETLGIVGESGSGKSVCQLSYLGLLPSPPLYLTSGQALFEGKDLLKLGAEGLRRIRGDRVAFIFQEPMTSLNPYLKIGNQLIEPLVTHRGATRDEAWKAGVEALSRVGIKNPQAAMNAYPHEFSGGMRQRVMIAMAVTTKPSLLIADEPTTALDVTVQAQILALLKELQRESGMAIILITHDLGVVAEMADRVMVMYAGRVFEEGTAEALFHHTKNPYTQALLRSTPRLDIDQDHLLTIGGTPPDLAKLPPGCPFEPRCPHRLEVCRFTPPPLRSLASGQKSYCHYEAIPEVPV